ncbi:MAG: acyloxyacyl hydrolase [Burkholderiales bacterium]
MSRRLRRAAPHALATALGLAIAASGAAAQTIAMGYGEYESISRSSIGVAFASPWAGRKWNADWSVRWNVDAAYWHSREQGSHDHQSLWDLGVTPSLIVRGDRTALGYPFAEIGAGVHVLSNTSIGTRYLGSSFQFGEFLGAGFEFGERREWAVSARVLHESNAGINEPNNGLTVFVLNLSYRLQ